MFHGLNKPIFTYLYLIFERYWWAYIYIYSSDSEIRTNIFGPLGQKQTFSWPKGPAHALGRPLAALRTLAGPFGPARWLFLAQRAKNISPDYRGFTVHVYIYIYLFFSFFNDQACWGILKIRGIKADEWNSKIIKKFPR